MAKILTEEDILNARNYLPISKKTALSKTLAQDCLTSYEIRGSEVVYPSVYFENSERRMMYGMEVLLCEYLHQIDGDKQLTKDEYDDWGEVSLFNQLDRFKASKNPDVRNRAYDIVDDYREFYRMLGSEINALVIAKNDIMARLIEYIRVSTTPEVMEEAMNALKESASEIKEYNEQKGNE